MLKVTCTTASRLRCWNRQAKKGCYGSAGGRNALSLADVFGTRCSFLEVHGIGLAKAIETMVALILGEHQLNHRSTTTPRQGGSNPPESP